MSLINDALKRAQRVHDQAPPPNPELPLRPAETEAPVRHSVGFLIPVAFATVALLGLFFVWRWVQTGSAKPEAAHMPSAVVEAPATTPAANIPEPVVVPAEPTATQPPVSAPPTTVAVSAAAQATPSNPATEPASSTNSNLAPLAEPAAPKPAPLKLQGVVWNPKRPSATISGKTLFLGERVGEFRLAAVTPESATLVGGGQTNILTLH